MKSAAGEASAIRGVPHTAFAFVVYLTVHGFLTCVIN